MAEQKSVADKVREEVSKKPEKKENPLPEGYHKVKIVRLEKKGKGLEDVKVEGQTTLLQEHIDELNSHKHNTLKEYRKI